jgi:hypothetical protein
MRNPKRSSNAIGLQQPPQSLTARSLRIRNFVGAHDREMLTFTLLILFEKSPCPVSRAAQDKVARVTESYPGNRQVVPGQWSSHLFPCRSVVYPNDGMFSRCGFTRGGEEISSR